MIMMMKVMNMMMNQHHQILHQTIFHHQIARLLHWPNSCYRYVSFLHFFSKIILAIILCLCAHWQTTYVFICFLLFFIQDICSFIYYYHYCFLLFCHIFFLFVVGCCTFKNERKKKTHTHIYIYIYIHIHSTNTIR